MAEALSYGIMDLGLPSEMEGDGRNWKFMGILAGNRYEWVITHMSFMHQKITTVPLYETLGIDALKFVLHQTKLATVATSAKNAIKLIKLKTEDTTGKSDTLKNLVLMEENVSDEIKALNEKVGMNMHLWKDVVQRGEQIKKEGKGTLDLPDRDDVLMFSYTSGTTGDPKAVKLTQKMMVANTQATALSFEACGCFDENDCVISYLPAAHVMEQLCIFSCVMYGMK